MPGTVEPLKWSPFYHMQSGFCLPVCSQRGTYLSALSISPSLLTCHNDRVTCHCIVKTCHHCQTTPAGRVRDLFQIWGCAPSYCSLKLSHTFFHLWHKAGTEYLFIIKESETSGQAEVCIFVYSIYVSGTNMTIWNKSKTTVTFSNDMSGVCSQVWSFELVIHG